MQTEITQSKKSSLRSALPFPLMTDCKGWNEAIYNHENYGPLRAICHERCVICGTRDWLFFERLDKPIRLLDDTQEWFRYLFGGIANRKTVCICLDCSLEARAPFWDRRLTERFVSKPDITNVCLNSYHQYYGLLKSSITLPARARRGCNRQTGSVTRRQRSRHLSILTQALGGKCRACSQVARLRFDCIRTQLIHHTAGTPAGKKFRFLYHQLLHGNLQLLCADCDEKKRVGQLRAYGHFRRLLFGRKLIGWCGTNASAASALSSRLRGEIPAKIRVKPLIEPVECSVESCGHVKQLHWLAADERTKRLLFICEDCLPKAPPHFRRLALLCELCGNFQARKPIYSPAELPLVDFANN